MPAYLQGIKVENINVSLESCLFSFYCFSNKEREREKGERREREGKRERIRERKGREREKERERVRERKGREREEGERGRESAMHICRSVNK